MGEAQGEAWAALSSLMSGICVCGAIGLGLDALLGTRPVFLVIGILAGNFLGVYLIYAKYFNAPEANARPATPAVAGWSKAALVAAAAPEPHPKAPELAHWPHVMHASEQGERDHAS